MCATGQLPSTRSHMVPNDNRWENLARLAVSAIWGRTMVGWKTKVE